MGTIDDLGRHGADQHALDGAVTAGPEDDEVGGHPVGLLDDRRCGPAFRTPRPDVEVVASEARHRLVQDRVALAVYSTVELIDRAEVLECNERPAVQIDISRCDGQDLEPGSGRPVEAGRHVHGIG